MPARDKLIYTDAPDALVRLNAILPLAARQAGLEPPLRELHHNILRRLAETGRAPSAAELASATGGDPAPALARLRALDLVVLDDEGEIAGAYPFTLEQTPHRVSFSGFEVRAMCSVDALAIGPMTEQVVAVRSRCHGCGAPLVFTQHDEQTAPASETRKIRVGIAWRDPGCCAAHSLCREMVFFCGAAHARAWQTGSVARHGVMRLDQAIALAKAFFLPLFGQRR